VQDNRVTLREAAVRLGISEGTVRKRIKRGRLESELGEDGRRYVYLNGYDPGADAGAYTLTGDLRDQVAYLRGQLDAEREANRENRRIIAALTSRIPALEAPQEALDAGPPEENDMLSAPQQPEPRSWWRRIFR